MGGREFLERENTPNHVNLTPSELIKDRWEEHHQTPIVEIHWIDAISLGDDWTHEEDIDTRPAPSLAIGYLIAETPHTITIASLVNEAHYANGITIPKPCVIHINNLIL
jgi:hypothetical protein